MLDKPAPVNPVLCRDISDRMNPTEALEWGRFLEWAGDEARSSPAKAHVRSLADPANWANSVEAANLRQQETQEALPLLTRDPLWGPLVGLQDPDSQLERLSRGAILEVEDLVCLRSWLYAIDSWSQIPRDEIRGELFRKALQRLPDPFQPLRILDRILTPESALSEKASPKLASLYAEIRSLKREIGSVLDRLMKTLYQKGVLQESFSDIRDGRYVIPVKISNQGDVEGIIYEASASRQTVFVEPKEVSPLNNRLRQRQNDLIQEIYVVLKEASEQLRPYGNEMREAIEILTYWDAVHARARGGLHYSGRPITVTEDRRLYLRQTAHPLLWKNIEPKQIIRNDVDFGDPARTFLITGPNTGGKTVLLKTIGLAGICARTGFPFPGSEHLEVPFFDSFFADLGDPQSIEQHLSSFSGHVLRFREILEQMTDRSLVLIDELNTATDPEEGAALGRAFLETLMSRGAIIVSTTHDPQLKAIAVSDKRVLNASMEFDESARTPTFKLVLGVPGRSRALETAERLGIPKPVLDLARQYLSRGHQEFENILAKLESDVQETGRARKEAVQLRQEAERLKKEWTTKTELSVNEMMDRTRQKLRRVLEQAQDEVRNTVRKLDELRSRKELDHARGTLNETFTHAASRLESALAEEAPEIAHALSQKPSEQQGSLTEKPKLEIGMTVRVPKWKNTGTILEIGGNRAKVAMGTLQVNLSLNEIEHLSAGETALLASVKEAQERGKKKSAALEAPPPPPSQLDLRGYRLDEALGAVERYLDLAFRSGALSEVTIVHGLGTGALREGTRKILRDLPYVKNFRDGGVGLGGAGATIVEFERD